MSRPPSDFTQARQRAMSARVVDPLTRAKQDAANARASITRPHREALRRAIAAMDAADEADAPEAVRKPLRAAVVQVKQDLRAAILRAEVEHPRPRDLVGGMPRGAGSLDKRMRVEIATIRKGGYTPGTRDRLIQKVRQKYKNYEASAERERKRHLKKADPI